MRIVWTTSAAVDLEQISDYLLEKHPELATTTIQSIFKSVSELKLFPARGRPGRKEGTRELVLTQLPYLAVMNLSVSLLESCEFCMERVAGRNDSQIIQLM